MESCLVYDHLLDHTSSVIYRHCSSHTIREQGLESKSRRSERASMHCLLSNSFLIRAQLVALLAGSGSALFIWNRNTSTHLHHNRICLLIPFAHPSVTDFPLFPTSVLGGVSTVWVGR